MQYINPFELLNITAINLSNIDGVTVNKAKKKLLTEIDLGDNNTIQHKGIELNKSDCIRITDDLDYRDKFEFHLFILQDKFLNEFLCKGSMIFFENFRAEHIYKQSEFLDFISPYFSEKYDYVLFENYKKKNHKNVKKIFSVVPITNDIYYDMCFKSTYKHIRTIDNDLDKLFKDIDNGKNQYVDNKFIGLPELIGESVNVTLINTLPSYFQSLRNHLAQTIRNLSVKINNDPFSQYEPAFKIIEISNNLSTDGLVKQNVTKAFEIIKNNYESGIKTLKQEIDDDDDEKEKKIEDEIDSIIYKDELAAYENISQLIEDTIRQITNKKSEHIINKFSELQKWLSLKIDIPKLNAQPRIFNKIQNKIAIQLKNLSATIWNDFHIMDISMCIIQLAISINVDVETRAKIKSGYDTLVSIGEKQKRNDKPISKVPFTGTWGFGIGKVLYGDTIYLTIFLIPIIPISRYSVKRFTENSWLKRDNTIIALPKKGLRYYGKLKLKPWQLFWKYGLIVGLSLLIIISIANSINSSKNYNNSKYARPTQSSSNDLNTKSIYSNSTPKDFSLSKPLPPPNLNHNNSRRSNYNEPIYNYLSINNGNITDSANIQPKYDNNIDNKLIISCGENADVAVKMIESTTNITIRYVYINKNTTFTITNIPEGKYYLKIAYGDRWGIRADGTDKKGRFTKNTLFKKGTQILDYYLIHQSDGSYQVPSYSLRLNVIYKIDDKSNRFNTDEISESEFYNG